MGLPPGPSCVVGHNQSGSPVVCGSDIGSLRDRSALWLIPDSTVFSSLWHSGRQRSGRWLPRPPGLCVTPASRAPTTLGWALVAQARNKVLSAALWARLVHYVSKNLPVGSIALMIARLRAYLGSHRSPQPWLYQRETTRQLCTWLPVQGHLVRVC